MTRKILKKKKWVQYKCKQVHTLLLLFNTTILITHTEFITLKDLEPLKGVVDLNHALTNKVNKEVNSLKVQMDKVEASFVGVHSLLATLVANSKPINMKDCLDSKDMVCF